MIIMLVRIIVIVMIMIMMMIMMMMIMMMMMIIIIIIIQVLTNLLGQVAHIKMAQTLNSDPPDEDGEDDFDDDEDDFDDHESDRARQCIPFDFIFRKVQLNSTKTIENPSTTISP